MTASAELSRLALGCAMALAVALQTSTAFGQAPAPAQAQAKPTLEKITGMWVEGPGFDIKYGGTYDQCAERCLGNSACVMIEYYWPEKKCNMYNAVRPLKTGGSSIIGTKKPIQKTATPAAKP